MYFLLFLFLTGRTISGLSPLNFHNIGIWCLHGCTLGNQEKGGWAIDSLRLQDTKVRGTDTGFRSPGEPQCLRPRGRGQHAGQLAGSVSTHESLLSSEMRASVTF